MDKDQITDQIINMIESIIGGEEEFFLVDAKVSPGKKISVFIDGDNGITINKCAQVSRKLEKEIDEKNIMGLSYTLEVSSPGLDSPLRVLRQYKKRIGKELGVLKNDGIRLEGILREVDDKHIILEEIVKNRKKDPVEPNRVELAFNEIKDAKQKIKF